MNTPATEANPADPLDADRLAEQAAHWIVQLTDGDESERARARTDFAAWKNADPRHAAAAASMEGLLGNIEQVRAQSGRSARHALGAAFNRHLKRNKTKQLGTAVALMLAVILPAWLGLRAYPQAYWLADLHTGTGQWETHTLTDGTRVTLNSASAIDLHYNAQNRIIELVQGEVLVDVAKDAARPFIVKTRHGDIRALGTRFSVRDGDTGTELNMLESRVSVRSAATGEAATVDANQRIRISTAGIGAIESIDGNSIDNAWKHHQLIINHRPLAEVLDELARYRPGHIQFDAAELNGITVSVVLPLDDTQRALQLLNISFPQLRIRTITPYFVRVDLQTSP